MTKIEIYPFKSEYKSTSKAYQTDEVVNFDTQPIILDLLGWVMGSEFRQSNSGIIDLLSGGYNYIPNIVNVPCLMAVAELDGKIIMFEHYRVKILKEE